MKFNGCRYATEHKHRSKKKELWHIHTYTDEQNNSLFWGERKCDSDHPRPSAHMKLRDPQANLDPTLLPSPALCLSWFHLENTNSARERGWGGAGGHRVKP